MESHIGTSGDVKRVRAR